MIGSAFNDVLTGDSNANIIRGGTGADRMTGLGGDDRYYVDNTGDRIIETAAGGID